MTNFSDLTKAIAHELMFWQGFVKTPRFIDGWVADVKTPELHTLVYDFILANLNENSKVMDVGSGVVSILNGTVPKSQLHAVDPLGDLYQVVFDYKAHGMKSPENYSAEELMYDNYFDIVHMSNAIDHSQDPKDAYRGLYDACKPGGYIILQGFEAEATFENFSGFHQFDFYMRDRKVIFYGRGDDMNAPNILHELKQDDKVNNQVILAEFITLDRKDWYVWILKK